VLAGIETDAKMTHESDQRLLADRHIRQLAWLIEVAFDFLF
jgi:hypothetical protein